jgi:hypothetical protein
MYIIAIITNSKINFAKIIYLLQTVTMASKGINEGITPTMKTLLAFLTK